MWGTIGSRALREYCWANVWMLRRFSKREKYCHDGGMPRPPSRPRLARGPTTAIRGPPAVPAKPLFCRGNSARVHDSHRLGAGMEPSASAVSANARSTATTGACLVHLHGLGLPGVQRRRSWPLPRSPAKPLFCRGNSARVHDSHPLGAGMEPSASFAEAEKYCLRGRGPRPPVKRSSSPTAGAQMGAIIEGLAPMAV